MDVTRTADRAAPPFRVLSIDGGGIRGIIPATVLADLELRCGQPISSLFDLIVGTSTGGILALGLTVPGETGTPRNSAESLCDIYGAKAETIFPGGGPPGWKQRLFGTRDPSEWLRNPWGVLKRSAQRAGSPFGGNPLYAGGARYFGEGLQAALEAQLSNSPIHAALTHVVITSYDMAYGQPVLFSSRPLPGAISNAPMVLVARATSAAPTYFEPQPVTVDGRQLVLVDGGVFANNPAILGFALAPPDRPVALVSLGTGEQSPSVPRSLAQLRTSNWIAAVRQVMDAAMNGGGELGDWLLATLASTFGRPHKYWRIQTSIGPCNAAMDDSSEANLKCLRSLAEGLVRQRANDLAAIQGAICRPG
jgi:predicted acylesterase/phospholipase RssA